MPKVQDASGAYVDLDYNAIGYDDFLQRQNTDAVSVGFSGDGTGSPDNESSEKVITSGQEIGDLFLSNVMRSTNYLPGVRGFKIDAKAGTIEAASLTLTGGSISFQKTSFTDSANPGYYIGPEGIYFGSASDATKLKFTIATGSLEYAGNLINGAGAVVLNSVAQTILKDFNFGAVDYAGAVKTGDIAWNGSGVVTSGTGVAIYRGGIVGASAGVVTFSIDAVTGNAIFSGTITGSTVTGGTIRTAASGERIRITSAVASSPTQPANSMAFIDSSENIIVGIGTEVFATSIIGIETQGNISALKIDQAASSTLVAASITTHTSSMGGGLSITENGSGVPLEINQLDTSNTHPVLALIQTAEVDTHFKKVIDLSGVVFYVSDGDSPDLNLTGTIGDICFRPIGGGRPMYCLGGTSWANI
ncbi:MAG: hypothetical protein WC346_07910 [Methanogenium sp.]|jgi:hypothetical protein